MLVLLFVTVLGSWYRLALSATLVSKIRLRFGIALGLPICAVGWVEIVVALAARCDLGHLAALECGRRGLRETWLAGDVACVRTRSLHSSPEEEGGD